MIKCLKPGNFYKENKLMKEEGCLFIQHVIGN